MVPARAGRRRDRGRALTAPLLIAAASLLFAVMGLCVKLASAQYGAPEIVLYRSLVGMAAMALTLKVSGQRIGTELPAMHLGRSASGVTALCLWFYAIGQLPLAVAMTLNYTSSVWMALFVAAGAVLFGARREVDLRLVAAVLAGFAGVALVLQPSFAQQQAWHGLAGLASGLLAATAYLQVQALGRAGEPEARVVFWFSTGGAVAGSVLTLATGTLHAHTPRGVALLAAIGLLATTAQWMMTRAYAVGRTLANAALQYLGIVFSFIFGVLLFDDPMTWTAVAGMLLIVGAGLVATWQSRRLADIPEISRE